MAVSTPLDHENNAVGSMGMMSSPYSIVFFILALVCVATRIITGLRSNLNTAATQDAKVVGILPYWIPFLGHGIEFGLRFQKFLSDARKRTNDGVFAVVLGGGKHNMVSAPSITKQILAKRSTTSNNDMVYYVVEKFFGGKGALRDMDPEVLFGPIHKVLHLFMRDPFLSKATSATVNALEIRTANLISFSRSVVDQSIWERSADVFVVPGSPLTAEASLFPLMRNFVGDITCELLMGKNFMENNPTILQDMWDWDAKFIPFLMGLPSWFPGMAKAIRARDRVIKAVQELHEALFALEDGRNPGMMWNDMSDVSNVMVARALEWKKAGAQPLEYSGGDGAILWAMNNNANQVVFWVLFYVYSQPELRADILEEIAPYVKVVPVKSEFPIAESPRLSIDMEALLRFCPLFKSTFYETMRLEAQGTSYKKIVSDFTVTESVEDAAIAGKAEPQSYKLPKGEMLCIPFGVHQKDERYWKDPDTFNPRRFFAVDEKDASKTAVEMGTMRVFGGGLTICKGRSFAEREVLAFTAAVLIMWDIEPVCGVWRHPGAKGGGGAGIPVKDIRVRMTRRAK